MTFSSSPAASYFGTRSCGPIPAAPAGRDGAALALICFWPICKTPSSAAWLTFSKRRALPALHPSAPAGRNSGRVDNQAATGVLMWVPGSIAFLVPLFSIGVKLLFDSETRRERIRIAARESWTGQFPFIAADHLPTTTSANAPRVRRLRDPSRRPFPTLAIFASRHATARSDASLSPSSSTA